MVRKTISLKNDIIVILFQITVDCRYTSCTTHLSGGIRLHGSSKLCICDIDSKTIYRDAEGKYCLCLRSIQLQVDVSVRMRCAGACKQSGSTVLLCRHPTSSAPAAARSIPLSRTCAKTYPNVRIGEQILPTADLQLASSDFRAAHINGRATVTFLRSVGRLMMV